MKPLPIVCLILLGHAALAQPVPALDEQFALRVGQANTAAQTPRGIKYQETLTPFVQQAIQACVPAGTAAPGTLGKFILVANVTSNGIVMGPDVQPRTSVSECFANHFTQETLSPSPVPPGSGFAYPIVVEVAITP